MDTSSDFKKLFPTDGTYNVLFSLENSEKIKDLETRKKVYMLGLTFLNALDSIHTGLDHSRTKEVTMGVYSSGRVTSRVNPTSGHRGPIMRHKIETYYGQLFVKNGEAVSIKFSQDTCELIQSMVEGVAEKGGSNKLVFKIDSIRDVILENLEMTSFKNGSEYKNAYIKAAREDPKLQTDLYPTITPWSKHGQWCRDLEPDYKIPEDAGLIRRLFEKFLKKI